MSYQDPTVSNSNYLRQPLYAPQPEQGYSDHYDQHAHHEPHHPPHYQPSSPPPHPPHAAAREPSTKFSTQGYRDLAWAILFVIHLIAYLGTGGYVLHKYADELTISTVNSTSSQSPHSVTYSTHPSYIINPHLYSTTYDPSFTSSDYGLEFTSANPHSLSSTTNTTSTDDHIRLQKDVIYIGLSSLALSAIVAVVWLSLTKSYSRPMIYIALVADIAASLALVVVCLYLGSLFGAILFGVFALLKAVWVYWMRSRIEFAAVILTHAVHCIQTWPASIGFALLSVVVQAAWIVGWGFSSVGFYYAATRVSGTPSGALTPSGGGDPDATQGQMQQDNTVSYIVVFLTLVSLYWTSQVVKNTLHVTVSGVAAAWYFLYPGNVPQSPTWGSFKRAVTTSFGSICLGSLVLSIVRALRVTVNMMANQPGNVRNGGAAAVRAFFYCITSCLLSILDRVVEYVNQYAFAQVAIYGKSYCEAAHATWDLFKVRGFDALLNDSLIGIALGFAALMGGLTSAAACGLLSHLVFTEGGAWYVWAGLGFVVGFAMTMLATEVVESAVTSLFVCICEDPAALQRTKPEVYRQLVPMIQNRYPSINLAAF